MVKQYIGARYVPLFDGEYNSEKAYEPLTVVTYLNNTYTSKKTVPAGVLPSNTDYWALTGNFNGQVEEYRQEVEGYRQDVEEYQEESRQALEHLSEDVDVVSTRVSNLEAAKNRKFLFIGDSYATSNSEFTVKSWVDYINDNLGLTHGVNSFKSNQGSSGIAHVITIPGRGDVNANFLIRHAELWDSDLTDKNLITDIVIAEGYNDGSESYQDILDAMAVIKTTVQTYYPNCERVYVAMIGRNFDTYATNQALEVVKKAYAKGSSDNGFIYISDASLALRDNEYIDRVMPIVDVVGGTFHPNDNGEKIIAGYITQGLLGGKYFEQKGMITANISVAGTTSGTIPTIYSILNGDMTTFIMNYFNLHIDMPTDVTVAGSWFRIADVTNTYFDNYAVPNRAVGSINGVVSSITASDVFTTYTTFDVGFWNGGMYFRPFVEPHENTTRVAFSSIGCEINIPR